MATEGVLARHRATAAKLVDRIAADSSYRQQLLDNPASALETLLGLKWVPEDQALALAPESLGGKCKLAKSCDQTCGKLSCSNNTCIFSCVWTSKVTGNL
jgi:hypothetical protein